MRDEVVILEFCVFLAIPFGTYCISIGFLGV